MHGTYYSIHEHSYIRANYADAFLHIVLGVEAYEQINEKIESLREEIAKYEEFAKACDFTDGSE